MCLWNNTKKKFTAIKKSETEKKNPSSSPKQQQDGLWKDERERLTMIELILNFSRTFCANVWSTDQTGGIFDHSNTFVILHVPHNLIYTHFIDALLFFDILSQ